MARDDGRRWPKRRWVKVIKDGGRLSQQRADGLDRQWANKLGRQCAAELGRRWAAKLGHYELMTILGNPRIQ